MKYYRNTDSAIKIQLEPTIRNAKASDIVPNNFSYVYKDFSVGDYIGVALYSYTNEDGHFVTSDPIIVKVTEKKTALFGNGYTVKVQMANGAVVDLFSREKTYSSRPYPYLNKEFVQRARYDNNARYSSPADVNVDSNDREKYGICIFVNNTEIKEALEKYRNTIITKEQREQRKKEIEEEKLRKREKDAEEQLRQKQLAEKDRQAGEEVDDLFNSMHK